MTTASGSHPTRAILEAFGMGRLEGPQLENIAEHIARCDACCQVLRGLREDTLIGLAREAQPTAEVTVALPSTGAANPIAVENNDTIPQSLRDHPRYRMVKTLGSGGMGTVYLAEHRLMERQVALKVIKPKYTADKMAVARFRREVKAAAKLNHTNIVIAYDAEQADEVHFFVMEFVEGKSLDRVLKSKGRIPIGLACDFIAQAAAGLQHAHDQGMVHRDIKPHNLMLTPQGTIKILDFGLARFADAGAEGQAASGGLTAVDVVIGTPDYLSPEQARSSRTVDIRGDLYSLGCTFYHLLAGQPPFPKGKPVEKMFKHCDETPQPIRQLRPEVPAQVVAVLDKLMAKRPEQRFQKPADVVKALASVRNSKGIVEVLRAPVVLPDSEPLVARPTAAPSHQHRWLIAVALLAALLMFSLLGAWVSTFFKPDPSTTPPVDARSFSAKVLYVLPQKGLWYADYKPVRDVLVGNGVEVVVASSDRNDCQLEVHAKNPGKPVPVDVVLGEHVKADDYDAIIFAGINVEPYVDKRHSSYRSIQRLLAAMKNHDTKLITALCAGQNILGVHGYLTGRRVAFSPFAKDGYQQPYQVKEAVETPGVVMDGPILTGSGPEDATAFGQRLVDELKKRRPH